MGISISLGLQSLLSLTHRFQRRGMKVQDVSKKGLKFGDEEEDAGETAEFEASKKAFAPLLTWLKKELEGRVSDGE